MLFLLLGVLRRTERRINRRSSILGKGLVWQDQEVRTQSSYLTVRGEQETDRGVPLEPRGHFSQARQIVAPAAGQEARNLSHPPGAISVRVRRPTPRSEGKG